MALTYSLWERVVQDLIECAQNVCFKDDWGEEARADAAQLFHELLEGSTSTIRVLDVSDPEAPRLIGTAPPGNASALAVGGGAKPELGYGGDDPGGGDRRAIQLS